LAAGLCPDPLGSKSAPQGPRPPSRNKGSLLLRGGEGMGGEGRGKGGERKGRRSGRGGGTCSKVLGG